MESRVYLFSSADGCRRRAHKPLRRAVLLKVLLSLAPAMTAASCTHTDSGTDSGQGAASGAADPVALEVFARDSCAFAIGAPILSLDCFAYNTDEAGTLAAHVHESGNCATLSLPPGEYEVIAIANSPFSFNLTALYRRDTMDLLEFDFEDDNPEHPIMGARASTKAPGACEMVLEPIMSAVILSEISNSISGYVRLEDPRACLGGINPAAKILQHSDFRPTKVTAQGAGVTLPCDVGLMTQYPGTVLYCYPNDTPVETLGVPRTTITLECEIKGETCRFTSDLPPLGRNSVTRAALAVDGPGEFRYAFEQ